VGNPKILIIEDDESIREALKCLFELSSIRANWAASGQQAIEALTDTPEPPSLVIMDACLPDINGLDLISGLRKKLPESSKVYLCSAHDHLALARHPQINGFIPKPFDADQFLNLVRQYS
jgi:DNA-binding NtrC family response regulator